MTPEGRELFRAPRKTQIDSSLPGRWGRGRGEQLFCVKQMVELSDSPLFVETVRLLTNIVLTPSIRLGVLYWCYQIYHLVEDHLVVANMAVQWLKLLFVFWMFASPRSIYLYLCKNYWNVSAPENSACPSQHIRLNFNCRTDPIIIIIIHRETFFFSLNLIKTQLNDR